MVLMLILSLFISGLIIWFLFFKRKKQNKEIIKIFKWKNDKELVKQTFLELLKGKPVNYFTISYYDNYYMQYMVLPESNEVYAECVSNEYLQENNKLNEAQENILKMRFIEPYLADIHGNVTKNYHKYYALENDDYEKIFDEFKFIFIEVFNVSERSKILLRFQYQ